MEFFGTTPFVFVGLTLVFFGGCAIMTGQGLAKSWRPIWFVVPYGLLLGLGDRFLTYALFEGELLTLPGYILDTAILIVIALAAYRLTQVNKMIVQYPWLYQRQGLFSWREKGRAQ
jgi:branched-chain amino acid transport system ATP-binding protein|tara:strand:+ start:5516 stop:5863 length:348 start_codon:yes stop_codon:yes gene_type:complete